MSNINKSVDVIIPVYNPGPVFAKLLERLEAQTIRPHKIIILLTVSDGDLSKDDVYTLSDLGIKDNSEMADTSKKQASSMSARSSEGVNVSYDNVVIKTVKKSEFDHAGTRRYGADLSNADYMLFMTQDALPKGKSLISRLLKTFEENDNNAISYAKQMAGRHADLLEKMTRKHNYPDKSNVKTKADYEKMGIQAIFCSDVCAMYDRTKYLTCGGFVHRTIFAEDMIMAKRVMDEGYSVTYAADAKVFHSHSYSLLQQFKRNFDIGLAHSEYSEVFGGFSSEKEGSGYAMEVITRLLATFHPFKCIYFIIQCAVKLLGYKTGRHYDILPKKLLKALSSNPGYFS
ncbi:MAG: glycosyltransferase family 2 protein [Lachnospiraceae bacterium]|nr:glycosyltransferase family 2 protein [Lachnospiraceae bacterium]MEE3461406.1 glycosyltransferase family 2 protein [Lachnospiraceae bacterium]